jgi:hypothetical protein
VEGDSKGMITVGGCGVQDDGDGDENVHSDSEDGEMVRMRMSVCMQRGGIHVLYVCT